MPEPDWHALLEDAVPAASSPPEALTRLEASVRRVRLRRRWVAAGSPVAVAVVAVSVVLASGQGSHTPRGAIATPTPAKTSAPTPSFPVRPSPTASLLVEQTATSAVPRHDVSPLALIAACRRYGTTAKQALPEDFIAAGAVECGWDVRRLPGDGTWQVTVVQRLSGDLAPVLAALRETHPTANPAFGCTLNDDGDPPLILFAANDSAVTPVIPRDTCAHVSEAVNAALEPLTRQTLSVLKVKQVKTEAQDVDDAAAAASGCPTVAKQPFNFPLTRKRSAGGAFPWWPAKPVVCIYDDDPIDEHFGDFVAGRRLAGPAIAALQQAIDRPGVRLGCASHAGKLAMISGSGGSYAMVELGTCWRVIRQDGATRSVGAADKTSLLAVLGDLAH